MINVEKKNKYRKNNTCRGHIFFLHFYKVKTLKK